MLGAILLSDRTLYALVIDEGLQPEDFYRERHRPIYEAMLGLYNENEPIDVLTVTEQLRTLGKLDDVGGAAAVDELAGAVPGRRQRPPLRADRPRARAAAAAARDDLRDPGERARPRARCPRELVEQAERAMLEVAHDDRQRTSARSATSCTTRSTSWQRLSRRGHVAHRHAVGLQATSTRSPAASSPAT